MSDVPLLTMAEIFLSHGNTPILTDVSLAIPRGTTLALLGDSSSGTTSLARIALGLTAPDAGEIRFDGAVLNGRRIRRSHRRRMSMVFRDPHAALNPRWRIRDSIAEPSHAFRLIGRQADPNERVTELLHMVGLPTEVGRRLPRDLTAEQAQRAAIARSLASDPALLVCDEPTGMLDVTVQAHLLNLLRDLQERLGLTLMFVSQDAGVARHMADLVAVMYRGRLAEFGAADTVFAHPRHPYTRQTLSSIPAVPALPTKPPAGGAGGCNFLRRCPLATARCGREVPELRDIDGVAVACHNIAESLV